MTDTYWFNLLLDWATSNLSNLIWSLLALVGYVVFTRYTLPLIERKVNHSKLKSEATLQAYHIIRVISGIVTLSVILIAWGIDVSGLLVISTSLLTLTGVALFASWSLLSNITSYFVLLFHASFRRGNFIRILDGDNYVEGYIAEVNLFNTRLITSDRETVVYPNNLILSRPAIVNPRIRVKSFGKVNELHPTPIDEPENPSQSSFNL